MSTSPSRPIETGHAPVKGIDMYYEIHGRPISCSRPFAHGR